MAGLEAPPRFAWCLAGPNSSGRSGISVAGRGRAASVFEPVRKPRTCRPALRHHQSSTCGSQASGPSASVLRDSETQTIGIVGGEPTHQAAETACGSTPPIFMLTNENSEATISADFVCLFLFFAFVHSPGCTSPRLRLESSRRDTKLLGFDDPAFGSATDTNREHRGAVSVRFSLSSANSVFPSFRWAGAAQCAIPARR